MFKRIIFGKIIGSGSKKLLPQITGLTTRAGRRSAFRSMTQFVNPTGKRRLANRIGEFAVSTAASGAILAAIDSTDDSTADARLAELKESLKDEIPGIATCQSIEEVMDLLKCYSLERSLEAIDPDTLGSLLQEAACLVRNMSRVGEGMSTTATLVSRRLDKQSLIEKYMRSLTSVMYLIGYFFGVLDSDNDLSSTPNNFSLIDYLLFGFSKSKSGVAWTNVINSIPVDDEAMLHVFDPVVKVDVERIINAIKDNGGGPCTNRELIQTLIENVY